MKTRRLGLHVLRGGFIVICNAAYFVALATMPLAEAMALFFVAPLFITLLSGPLLGERVGWRRWLAVGIGMLGVVIMVRPSGAVIQYVALLPLIAALGYAGTQLMTRRLGATDGASTMSFYIQLALLAASAVMGLVVGDGRFAGGGQANMEFLLRAWIMPTPVDIALFAASGFTVAIGGFAISQAYRLAAATTVAPFEYLALPFAVLWGYLIWGDFPDLFTFLGIALIVAGGLTVILRGRTAV